MDNSSKEKLIFPHNTYYPLKVHCHKYVEITPYYTSSHSLEYIHFMKLGMTKIKNSRESLGENWNLKMMFMLRDETPPLFYYE